VLRNAGEIFAGRFARAERGRMAKTLLILNDPSYGTERSYNGLRLAGAVAKHDDSDVRVFLIGDAVGCAVDRQKVPDGWYHLDHMIAAAARHGADVGCCGNPHGRPGCPPCQPQLRQIEQRNR
jgi:sulfur relay (sulfurtransferase) complex TusBCD TusD component (DsrE family)